MKLTRNFMLPLAALFFGLLLVPQAAHAQTSANCPTEPKLNVPIADGETYAGSNCVLNTAADVDSFVFSGNQGETWNLVLNAVSPVDDNVCLTIYDPNNNKIDSGCTSGGPFTVLFDQVLPTTGKYTMDVYEVTSGAQGYGVSAERLLPFPPVAQPVNIAQPYPSAIAVDTQADAFTFQGVTTGLFQVSVAAQSPVDYNLCMTLYYTTGVVAGTGCTSGANNFNILIAFTPASDGEIMAFVSAAGWSGTQSYTFEVSCLSGNCGTTTYPPCTLKDAASYNTATNTLTMIFTVGNNVATTWNAWLVSQSTITPLSGFPIAQAKTVPPVLVPKTAPLSPSGTVGILSTLTTPTKGIFCSSYVQVNTGTQ
jgi:hypothetical protein